jgi:hypothetical protein
MGRSSYGTFGTWTSTAAPICNYKSILCYICDPQTVTIDIDMYFGLFITHSCSNVIMMLVTVTMLSKA